MATRFRRVRTRRSKAHGRKALKTRKMKGGDFMGRMKGVLGMRPTVSIEQKAMNNEEKKLKRIAELEEDIDGLMKAYLVSFKLAQKNPRNAYGMKTAHNSLKKKAEELRKLVPEHDLVKSINKT